MAPHIATRVIAEFQHAMMDPNISESRKSDIAKAFLEASASLPRPRWASNPGPQAAAYLSEADELFFGGSTGPGKSALLLGLGLTAHEKTLILRLEGTNLVELKDQLKVQMVDGDRWKNIGNGGEFTTYDGRRLELLGCDDDKRASALQGRPHDLLGFDELPQFNEMLYRRLAAWLRTTSPDQRCRIVGAGNPPLAPEEEWVIRYWAPWLDSEHPDFPAAPGELRWFANIDGKETEVADGSPIKVSYKGKDDFIRPRSRTFIPATLEDNPDLNNPDYRARLALLPEPMRSQLLYGDMQIGKTDNEYQLIPTAFVINSMKKLWRPEGKTGKRMTCASLDVAMGGKDNLCLAKRYDRWIAPLQVWKGKDMEDGPTIVKEVLLHLESLHMPMLIDVGATPGGSAVTAMRLGVPGLSVWAVNFGCRSEFVDKSGKLGMANTRAEAYWRLREALDPNLGPPETRLALPDDRELLAEICSVRWQLRSGKVLLEKKEDIQKRLGRSPDRADAVAMSLLADRKPDGGWLSLSDQELENSKPASGWVTGEPYGSEYAGGRFGGDISRWQ